MNFSTYVEKNERRTERITLTLTSTERAKLETQSRAQGCALTEYLRALIRYAQDLEAEQAQAKAEAEAKAAKVEAAPSVVKAEVGLTASV